jgi:2-alkenal reductase
LNSRFVRIVTIWALLLATAWVSGPYLVRFWASATGPGTVTARGNLSQAEQATIKLFQTVSPSVVHVFAQGARERSALDGQQQDVVQSGSGIVWDAAGHLVTNYHVIKGTTEIGVRLTSGEFVSARLVGVAPNYDLAVLQVEAARAPVRPIIVGI